MNRSKTAKQILKTIGIYEVIGGLIGLGIILRIFFLGSDWDTISLFAFGIIFLFYLLSIYAGILLFTKLNKKSFFSEIVQFLQIIYIGIGGFVFNLSAGISIYFGFADLQDFLINFYVNFVPGGDSNIFILENDFRVFYINLMPIIIIYLINRNCHELNKQNN